MAQASSRKNELHFSGNGNPNPGHPQGAPPSPSPPVTLLPPLPLSLEGKVALVTGASSGIGRVFALFLVQQGCHVAAAARRTGQLESLAREVRALRCSSCGVCSASCKVNINGQEGGAAANSKPASCSDSSCPSYCSSGSSGSCSNGIIRCNTGCGSSNSSCNNCSSHCSKHCFIHCSHPPFGELLPVALDVTGPESEVERVVGGVWDHFGGISVIVNNAGFRGSKASVLDITDEDFMRALATNVRGPWVVTKAVVRRIVAAKTGSPKGASNPRNTSKEQISTAELASRPRDSTNSRFPPDLSFPTVINIASTSGLEGALLAHAAAYSSSKAACIRLTKAMAIELGHFGIRCNAIAPGIFDSDITHELLQQPWMQRNAKVVVPLERWGATHPDLTSTLFYLAGDSSRHVTGACIVVDGGHSLMRMRLNPRL